MKKNIHSIIFKINILNSLNKKFYKLKSNIYVRDRILEIKPKKVLFSKIN